MRIQQIVFGVVSERLADAIHHTPTRAFEDSLRRGRVPFGRGAEARVYVRGSLRDETNFERAAHRRDLVRTERREIRGELGARMATTTHHAQRLRWRGQDADRPRRGCSILPPCAVPDGPVVHTSEGGG